MEGVQDHWQEYFHQKLQCGVLLLKQVKLNLIRLYLYGGYQILHGSLDDFYTISLD
jgi:hypothetical protein